LPPEYQDELLRDDFYLQIIRHEKFNPRLVEWLSTYRRLKKVRVSDYQAFVSDLLQDPSEIWRHAYEQEISDAGRSLLLALFSVGGKASAVILKLAFMALHAARAKKYGFERRPEDFRSALRELAGAFIKPSSAHAFEVVDASVLDLLNAVVRDVPENALDIVGGASSFDQIDRVWSFAQPSTDCRPSTLSVRSSPPVA
jgi:DNA-binding ferritin-like protein (Dps family)